MLLKDNPSGRTRIVFEVHSFHGDRWFVIKTGDDRAELAAIMDKVIETGDVRGVRLVRCTQYLDHAFVATVLLARRLKAGVQDNDPLLPADQHASTWCETEEDLAGDSQRQLARNLVGRFLEERRLTPIEVLYSDSYARGLNDTGTTLQGALQRVAVSQVAGKKIPALTRLRVLMGLTESRLNRLLADAKSNPPRPLAPGSFGAVCRQLDAQDPATARYHQLRAVVGYIATAQSWIEKLDRLMHLCEGTLKISHLCLLDMIAGDILASPGALRELTGVPQDRLDALLAVIDLHAGIFHSVEGEPHPGCS